MFKKCLALAALLLGPTFMVCQVVPAARGGAPPLSAGGFISYYDTAYASNKPIGFGGFIDWSPYRNFGIEAEGRWLMFNTNNDFREYTYLAGAYRRSVNGDVADVGGRMGFSFITPFPEGSGRLVPPICEMGCLCALPVTMAGIIRRS